MFRVVGWLLRNSLIVQMHTYVTLTFDCDDDDTDGQEKTVLPNPIDSIETFFPCPDDEDNPEFWANAFGDTLNSSSNATGGGSNVQRPRADASEAEWSAFFGPVTTVRPRQSLTTFGRAEAEEGEDTRTREEMVAAVFKREAERKEVLDVGASAKDLKLFLHLAPYFDGR